MLKQPLASIHSDAQIAEGVQIDPFATIAGDVVIEEGSWIGSHAVIQDGARIGKNCKIFPGAVISTIPQDLKFQGEDTLCIIGDHTTIREYATINRGTAWSGRTEIGKHVLIMAYSHIAHDCVIGDRVIITNACNLAGHVVMEPYARLGGMCGVHQFVRIGRHAMVQGASAVFKDVPPYTLAGRNPLRYTGVNSVGLRRAGLSNEDIAEIQDIYRHLYAGGNNSNGLKRIEDELSESSFRKEIMDFVRDSERGIIRRSGQLEEE